MTQDGPAPVVEGRKFRFSDESTIGFTGSKVTGSHDGGFQSFAMLCKVSIPSADVSKHHHVVFAAIKPIE